MDFEYDEEADAIYIRINDQPYAYGEELDPQRRIDYAADGTPIGTELLCVSTGADLQGLPEQDEITKLLAPKRIRILGSDQRD